MKRLHTDYMRSNEGYASWHKDPRHHWVHWMLLLIVVLGSVFAFNSVFQDVKDESTAEGSNLTALYRSYALKSEIKNVKSDTEKILSLRGDLHMARDGGEVADIQEDMVTVAQRRKEKMLQLIRSGNTKEVLSYAISKNDRAQLPAEVQAQIEVPVKKADFEGTYTWMHADYFNSGEAANRYSVMKGNKQYTVHYTDESQVPNASTGDQVAMDGVVFGDSDVVVNNDANNQSVSVDQNASDAASGTATVKHVAVILVNFQDNTMQPFTTSEVASTYFTAPDSIKKFYEENSFGQWTLTGDVFGYYTIPMNQIPTGGCTDPVMYNVSALADAAATSAGVNLSTYDKKVYIFPKQLSCGWTGLGTMGGPRSWLNVTSLSQMSGTGAHELGHNFNLHHASAYNCVNSNGVRVSYYGGTCVTGGTQYEYGDYFDVMGKSTYRLHFNGFHKGVTALNGPNWYSSTNVLTLNPQTTGGTYTIKPLGAPTTGLQTIRIPIGTTGQYYYLEFRQPYGVFENYTNSAVADGVNGILVHIAGDFSSTVQSKLLDMTPATPTFADASLGAGESYTDGSIPMTITVNSISPAGAIVAINFAAGAPAVCTHYNPGLTVGSAQATDTPLTKAYSVTLTNFDSPSCASSAFNYSATLPTSSGASVWSKTPESFTETMTPGSSLTKTFYVTSPSNTVPGNYNITFTGMNAESGLSAYTASQTVLMNVPIVGTGYPVQVDLINPANGQVIDGDVLLSSYPTAEPGNVTYKLYIDGILKKTCSGGWLCQVNVPSAQVSSGSHLAEAIATNPATGLTTIDSATFTKTGATTQPPVTVPQISLTIPTEGGSVSGDVTITSTLPAGSTTTNMETKLFLDGTLKNTCTGVLTCTTTVPSAQVSTGSHSAMATVTYTPSGASTTDTNVFTKTQPPVVSVPTISIPIPANNATYSGELVITTSLATTDATNIRTDIMVDGAVVHTCNNTVSCLKTLLASETTLGTHTISATATHVPSGMTSTTSKTVTKVVVPPPTPTTAPQITVTSPTEGSTVTSGITLSSSLASGASVTNVQSKLYLDGILKNTCVNTATCTVSIPAAQISNGTHNASATATYVPNGSTTNDSNTFTKNQATPPATAPTISLSLPANGASVSGDLTVSAQLGASVSATTVQTKLYVDTVLKKTCTGVAGCTVTVPAADLSVGAHTASATATSIVNNLSATDSHSFTKPAPAPTPVPPTIGGATTGSGETLLSLTAPANGAVISGNGNVTVTATTSPEAIAAGEYIVLSRKIVGDTTNMTYQIGNPCYNTTCSGTIVGFLPSFSSGTHTITAYLRKAKPTGGWNTLSTVNITFTKQ